MGNFAVRIDHNGSTSVPGLAAKPVIDIQVSVPQLQPIKKYEELKMKLINKFGGEDFSSRQAYAEEKTEFITNVTEEALKEGYPHDL